MRRSIITLVLLAATIACSPAKAPDAPPPPETTEAQPKPPVRRAYDFLPDGTREEVRKAIRDSRWMLGQSSARSWVVAVEERTETTNPGSGRSYRQPDVPKAICEPEEVKLFDPADGAKLTRINYSTRITFIMTRNERISGAYKKERHCEDQQQGPVRPISLLEIMPPADLIVRPEEHDVFVLPGIFFGPRAFDGAAGHTPYSDGRYLLTRIKVDGDRFAVGEHVTATFGVLGTRFGDNRQPTSDSLLSQQTDCEIKYSQKIVSGAEALPFHALYLDCTHKIEQWEYFSDKMHEPGMYLTKWDHKTSGWYIPDLSLDVTDLMTNPSEWEIRFEPEGRWIFTHSTASVSDRYGETKTRKTIMIYTSKGAWDRFGPGPQLDQ